MHVLGLMTVHYLTLFFFFLMRGVANFDGLSCCGPALGNPREKRRERFADVETLLVAESIVRDSNFLEIKLHKNIGR